MVKTTNASTVNAVVNLRARIQREFEEMVPLIQLDTKVSLEKAAKKLKFIYRLIDLFKKDEEESLLKSDKIALELLQNEVLDFIKNFERKTGVEREATAKSLRRMAEATLATE